MEAGTAIVSPRDLPEGFLDLEAFLKDRPHAVTAVAEESCFLAEIPATRRDAFLRSHPGLVLRLLEGTL